MPKQKQNAFSIFLSEVSRKKGISMANASPYASAEWNRMTPEQKKKYCPKGSDVKYATTGEAVSAIEKRMKDEATEQYMARLEMDSLFSMSPSEIVKKPFNIMAVNFYCHTDMYTLFSEVAVGEFSLEKGYTSNTNIILGYEPKRLGYENVIKNGAAECGMAPPPLPEANQDPQDIFDRVKESLIDGNGKLRPVYTRQEKLVKMFFSKLCNEIEEDSKQFNIYPLDDLFMRLRNICALDEADRFPRIAIAEAKLNIQPYVHEHSIACEHHQLQEMYYKCASTVIIDSIYTICEHCSPLQDIELIPGYHIPHKND